MSCGACAVILKVSEPFTEAALNLLRDRAYAFFSTGGVLTRLEWETMCPDCAKAWREGNDRLRLEQAVTTGQAVACALAKMDWPSVLRQRAVTEPVGIEDFPIQG